MPGAGGGANLVKELRDELAKEARRRAEAEEYIAEMAGRAEVQDKINDTRAAGSSPCSTPQAPKCTRHWIWGTTRSSW